MRAFVPYALRDVVLLAITAGLLALDAQLGRADLLGSLGEPGSLGPSSGVGGPLATGVGVAAGVMVAIASFLLHEWGHWSGAILSGGIVAPPPRTPTPFLFHFDTSRSTRKQFLWMSAGGYSASIASVLLILWWADLARTSGIVALGLATLGVAVTFALEIPTTVRVARGGSLPTGGVYDPE